MAKIAKFSLKLLIDEKRNKVVMAEADQDFVDVLISLLTLPMDMGIEHFETEACKSMLLSLKSSKDIHRRRLKLNMGDSDATKFFMCSEFFNVDEPCCSKEYSNFETSKCSCGHSMSTDMFILTKDVGEVIGDCADGVFVNCRSSFIVTDDLNVSVNSIGVIMKVLNDLGYLDFSDLQETLLDVGFEEVLTLLGCFFSSETPLTCAFLRQPCITRNLQMLSTPVQNSASVEPSSVYSVKVFVRKSDREILYAECNEDVIDSLLSFLIFPLEFACSLSNDNTILGCVGNLCRSPCRRASASNFYQIPDYYSCTNNNLFGFLPSPSLVYECYIPRDRHQISFCEFAREVQWYDELLLLGDGIVKVLPNNPKVNPGTSSGCGTGFMKKNTKFIVSNDLIITPMNSSSTISLVKKMQVNISDLEEHQLTISRAELINILRASLVSSSALTNGLSNLLLKKPKEET